MFTVSEITRAAIAAQDDAAGLKRPNVSGPLSRRRRTLVATLPEWRTAGYVSDDGAVCVACGDFTPWSGITLGHMIPWAVGVVTNGRSRVTDTLPECGTCNRAHGAADAPYVPRYGWPSRMLDGTRVALPADPGPGYAYAGRNACQDDAATIARKIAQWVDPRD